MSNKNDSGCEPWDEGFNAYEDGAEEHECPHRPGTTAAHDWNDGWVTAQVQVLGARNCERRDFP